MLTIKDIKERLEQVSTFSDPFFTTLSSDTRLGVQKAIEQTHKRLQKEQLEEERLEKMLFYEKEAYEKGYQFIAGIDEVGRGPLAGPVVAAAVVLPKMCKIPYLNDSKKISKSKHQLIYDSIQEHALAIGIGIVDESEIDKLNIYQATKVAMLDAVSKVNDRLGKVDYLLLDAMTLDIDLPQLSLIKGDSKSMSIAAASIVAKVTRDKMMEDYNTIYPGYHFEKNAGYGTKEHLQAIQTLGITPIHRKSFEPIKSLIQSRNY